MSATTRPPRTRRQHGDPPTPLQALRSGAADLRGIAQLVTHAVAGATDVVEGVHQSVWSMLGVDGAAPGRTGGLTGLVYGGIRAATGLAGRGTDRLLGVLAAPGSVDATAPTPALRDALLAVLNGVVGDHLAASGNPLATPMTLRHRGRVLDGPALRALPDARGRILVLVHGLCMNDRQWRVSTSAGTVDHGGAIADAHGYTCVHVRYNSGLPVADNGRELAQHLQRLHAHWPVPVEHIGVLAHSMGGLLARSAARHAEDAGLGWRSQLRQLVFLGTPHHGAPLERAGDWIDTLLAGSRFTAPFARIGKLRSAGITDLRHGRVGGDGVGQLPLPAGVACHAIAAATAARAGLLAERLVGDGLIGDGLVPLDSALGRDRDPRRSLDFAADAQFIAWNTGHLQLLSSQAVQRKLLEWLAPAA